MLFRKKILKIIRSDRYNSLGKEEFEQSCMDSNTILYKPIRDGLTPEAGYQDVEDYLIQEHPQKTRNPGKPKIAGEESAKHERRRTNDEPSESNLPLARTNAGECSQNPN